jgi:hypothetical protein
MEGMTRRDIVVVVVGYFESLGFCERYFSQILEKANQFS